MCNPLDREWTNLGPVTTEISRRLSEALQPLHLEVRDDSAHHAGHGGYRDGVETHLHITVVSAAFTALSRLDRQRRILALLSDLMDNPVHALSIDARPPQV